MPRKFMLNKNDQITHCPECGNNTEFVAHSQQCAEDACEVWVVCRCGYDPTFNDVSLRFEDVWGGTDEVNCRVALDCWNDAIEHNQRIQPTPNDGAADQHVRKTLR